MSLAKTPSVTLTENQSPSPETQWAVIEIFLFKIMNELLPSLTSYFFHFPWIFCPILWHVLEISCDIHVMALIIHVIKHAHDRSHLDEWLDWNQMCIRHIEGYTYASVMW